MDESAQETVRVQATIPVAGLARGQIGRLPREQAIELGQAGWVKILDNQEDDADGVSGVRAEGIGNGNEPDPDWQPQQFSTASDPDAPTVEPTAGGSGLGHR